MASHIQQIDARLVDPSADQDADEPGAGSTSLWLDVVMLAGLLLVGMLVSGLNGQWFADEGALLYQTGRLGAGEGWQVDHPFPEADPDRRFFPVHLSVHADDGEGFIVLAKHTVLTRLMTALDLLGGYPAMVLSSMVGGFATAVASARLAGLIDRRAARPALWLTGVASPIYISSFVAWGHTWATALVGWAVFILVSSIVRHRGPAAAVVGAALLGSACLIRTEAALAGVAVTMALAAAAAVDRPNTVRWLRNAALAFTATVAGVAVDLLTAIPDRGLATLGDGNELSTSWIGDRLHGFSRSWLAVGYDRVWEDLLVVAAAAAVIMVGMMVRQGRRRLPLATAIMVGAVALLVARFAVSTTIIIPGLLTAFPLLFAMLAMVRRTDLTTPTATVCAAAAGLFTLAVLATQYRWGGGGEWGGRYFMLGVPMAVAVGAAVAVRRLDAVPSAVRRRLMLLAAASVLIVNAMGLLGMRGARFRTGELVATVKADMADPGDADGRPVVISTVSQLGRWAWEDIDDGRWLLVPVEDLDEVMPLLRSLEIDRLVLVTADPEAKELVAPWYRPDPDASERPEWLNGAVTPMTTAG